jgi:hypothetical protein
MKTNRKEELLQAINKVKVFCFNSQHHKDLKDSITGGQYDALLGWMELFKDVPSNYSVPAFKPDWR